MTITQTVDVPADRWITLEVPREIPTGRTILSFTPVDDTLLSTEDALAITAEVIEKYRPALEKLAE